MTLSLPNAPFETSPWSESPAMSALAAVAGEWGLPRSASLELICESENTTVLATSPDGVRSVFRLHRRGYNAAAEIRSEHAWIEALRREEIVRTPAVLKRRDGDTVGSLSIAGGGERPVAAFAFMDGCEPAIDGDLPEWFRRLGELTARLHRHSRSWQRPPDFRRRTWTFATTLGARPHWGDWRSAVGLDAEGREIVRRAADAIRAELAAYGTEPDRFGLIHADLRLANLLVDGDRLGVIDFDDCGFGWFMYDFAAAISFIEHEPAVDELRDAWLHGYRTVAPVAAAEEAIVETLVMLRRILLTAWIASRPCSDAARALGARYTAGTVDLAERFLSQRREVG